MVRMKWRGRRQGFTMVELSLSLAFIAVLSITVVLIITNAVSSYRRGLTLNQVNTVGMDLVDDLRAAVQNAPTQVVESACASIYLSGSSGENECIKDQAHSFVSVTRRSRVITGGETISDVPVFGAFCTGTYSYIWNSGYYFNDQDYKVQDVGKAKIVYRYIDKESGGTVKTVEKRDFKLLKIEDDERAVCVSEALNKREVMASNASYLVDGAAMRADFDITKFHVLEQEPVDLLGGKDSSNNLALYDLYAPKPAISTDNNDSFYAVSFILGTIQGGVNIKASGNYCATPGGKRSSAENFDYCAINKFNFAAQANGGQK